MNELSYHIKKENLIDKSIDNKNIGKNNIGIIGFYNLDRIDLLKKRKSLDNRVLN